MKSEEKNEVTFGPLSGLVLITLIMLLVPARIEGQASVDTKLELLKAYPDLIVISGKISTMDARLGEVQAMAVRNNRIIALGTNDEIRPLAGPRTEILDVKGRRVLPGLIDGHTHPHLWAVDHRLGAEGDITSKRYNDPQLKIVYAKGNDQAEILRSLERVVRQRAQELGPGKWIWVGLFGGKSIPESRELTWPLVPSRAATDPMLEKPQFLSGTASIFARQRSVSPNAPLTRQFLDTIAPDNPLIVQSSEAIGPGAVNTRAKEAMEKYLGEEKTGLSARNPVLYDIFLRGRTEEKMDLLKREMLECVAAKGVTTYSNHYYNTASIMQTHNLLYQRGELPVRWAWWLGGGGTGWGGGTSDNDLSFVYRTIGDFRGIGNDYIWNVGVSNEAWEPGVFCTTAKPLDSTNPNYGPPCSEIDYEESPGYRNVRAALESGLRIGFLHAFLDGTYDAAFHMVEQAMAEGKLTLDQVRALRISFEHDQTMRPDQAEKMAKYNIRPAFNPYWLSNRARGQAFLKDYGEQYMTWMQPLKTLVDAGVHVVFNTDRHLSKVPIESKDMDYPSEWDGSIWGDIEFYVTRRMISDGITYARNEALDRATLMKAATIWGAEQLLNEKNIGSLEVGKLADFIVLDKDYFTIPEDQIRTINTLLTAVGGKTVYKAPNF